MAQKHVGTASDIIMDEMCQRGRPAQASAAAMPTELAAQLPHKHGHVKQHMHGTAHASLRRMVG